MPVNTSPLTEDEIRRLFAKESFPAPKPEERKFEIALVLGGTLSAGCYTAGVLDFLVQALDEMERLQVENDPSAPRHKVVLKIISGTSGGGICGTILARAATRRFPHVTPETDAQTAAGNPFYRVWVDLLDIEGMTDTDDLDQGELVSFLNGKTIDQAAEELIEWDGEAAQNRAWVADPLRLIMTNTNLNGVPYAVDFDGPADQTFVDLGDYVRFALSTDPATANVENPRPDELVVRDGSPGSGVVNWEELAQFAKATGAFPGGFPPRRLTRPMEHYRYRVTVLPSDTPGRTEIRPLVPDWDRLRGSAAEISDIFSYLAVDGGAVNNQPVELGRTALAGVDGRNPRSPLTATRGVVLIDPFADAADPLRRIESTAIDALAQLFGGLIAQTRYSTSDMILASLPDVFSRYLITPIRGERVGSKAIVSAGFGALMGFLSKEYRRHDYFLGRENAWHYLREVLVLDENHPMFDEWRDGGGQSHLIDEPERRYLPIIPLLGSAAARPRLPNWPAGVLDVKKTEESFERRARAVVDKFTDDNRLSDNFLFRMLINFAVDVFGPRILLGIVSDKLREALRERRL